MVTVYYDKDADLSLLKGKTIGILGYGSQGHAHALNLRDSGLQVKVAELQGTPAWERAKRDGFEVASASEVAEAADVIVMLVPDTIQPRLYREAIQPELKPGKTLMFAHGFNIHYREIIPPAFVDVSMVAPKAPGHRMREVFVEGIGVPGLLAVHQDASGKAREVALAYARGIGCTRAGVVETTFKDETETDLFGEQAVLCGGVSSLIKAGFETLVEAGYPPELAYFECLHEMKLIVDLIWQGGLSYMRYSVSDTAEYGDYTRGPMVIDQHVRENMRRILREVQDGTFAREWVAENEGGQKRFQAFRQQEAQHPIEEVGKRLRAMMPWIKPPQQ